MQCAARSAPQSRRRPRARARISFVPTPSVDAARKRFVVERMQARRRRRSRSRPSTRRPRGGARRPCRRSPARHPRRRSCGSGSSEDGAYDRLRPWPSGQVPGTVSGTWPAGLGEALAGQLRAALRAVRQEAHERLADRHRVAARQLEAEDVARALPPSRPARRPAAAARPAGAPPALASSSSIQSRGGCTSSR